MKKVLIIACVFAFMASPAISAGKTIEKGSTVKLDYTLKVKGQVIESSKVRGPIEFTIGDGNLIPGLDNKLIGLKEGQKKVITIPPDEAYGPVKADAFQEFEKSMLPNGVEAEVGMQLNMVTGDNIRVPVSVSQVKEETVVINFNHPLAGQELIFDVQIVSVQ